MIFLKRIFFNKTNSCPPLWSTDAGMCACSFTCAANLGRYRKTDERTKEGETHRTWGKKKDRKMQISVINF